MKKTLVCLTGILVASFSMASALGAERYSPHTLKLSPNEASPEASLADMHWLAGRWVGTGFGATIEEFWFEPVAGQMSGIFRLHGGDWGPSYSLMTLVETRGRLVLYMRQFEENLATIQGMDEILTYPFVAKGNGAMFFQGMSFHPNGDELTVYVAQQNKDGAVEEFTFNYRRAPLEKAK